MLIKEYKRPIEFSHRLSGELIIRLRELLDALHDGSVPDKDYSIDELKHFCGSLINGQRGVLTDECKGTLMEGSWCIMENSMGMNSEMRVDYAFIPTYLALAILVKVRGSFPGIARGIPGYDNALKRGFSFAWRRRFEGHGYEARAGLEDAMNIFRKGGIFSFIKNEPGFSPEFKTVIDEVIETKGIKLNGYHNADGVLIEYPDFY